MSDLLDIEHFDSPDQEADWWFENRDKVEAAFERAESEGRLKRGSEALTAALRKAGEATLTIRISEQDLAAIRELAGREGQSDETYASGLLHQAIEQQRKTG
jgi:predicted DNA binding CopG/RHH family protein